MMLKNFNEFGRLWWKIYTYFEYKDFYIKYLKR